MGDLGTTTGSRSLAPRNLAGPAPAKHAAEPSARNDGRIGFVGQEISRRLAQRRVALLLLPLRLWIGVGWLRYGVAKALQPEWFDGTAVTAWLGAQPEAAAPLSLYADLLTRVVERAAVPLGIVMLCAEIAIGLALVTGTLTNLALLSAIVLNVNILLAGSASPSQYYIIIQVVLLAGGAGAAYGGDRWLSRAMPSVLLTGHRGLVDGVDAPRSLLVVLAAATGGLALAVVPAIGHVLPRQGMDDDPGFALLALLMLVALLALAVTRATHRSSAADPDDDWSEIGEGYGAAQLPPRPGQQRPAPAGHDSSNGVSGRVPPPPAPSQRPPAPSQRPPAPSAPVAQRPPPPPQQEDPWPSSVPPPTRRRPAAQDQPTTQFVRPRRSRASQPPADPYAELRDLPPVEQQ